MIRRIFVAIAIAFIAVSTVLWAPLSATAGAQDYSQNQQASQSYAQSGDQSSGQTEYGQTQDASDYSYANNQSNQAAAQDSTQESQYAQQEQSYQSEQQSYQGS
ncbi:MAG: hypothetical protein AAF215_24350 [Cyanobacteria bacterium P01_A01_bin.123]